MISLEQIRLLESRITRALELIRVLKEENSTLRRGLESAQKRMRELEGLVDGLKTDQREIESIIVRTLHNLDDLEETAAGGAPAAAGSPASAETHAAHAAPSAAPAAPSAAPAAPSAGRRTEPRQTAATAPVAAAAPAAVNAAAGTAAPPRPGSAQDGEPGGPAQKEELDIF